MYLAKKYTMTPTITTMAPHLMAAVAGSESRRTLLPRYSSFSMIEIASEGVI